MILSVFSEPDARVPRLAVALAQFRRRTSQSVAMLDWRAPPPEPGSSDRNARVRRSLDVELSAATSHYRDVLIDTDDLFSPAALSSWIAARTAVFAMSPKFALDAAERGKLIARIERGWLFNPRLRILLLPVCLGVEPSVAHLDMATSFVRTVPCIGMASTCIHYLRKLKAASNHDWDEQARQQLSALWHDIDTPFP